MIASNTTADPSILEIGNEEVSFPILIHNPGWKFSYLRRVIRESGYQSPGKAFRQTGNYQIRNRLSQYEDGYTGDQGTTQPIQPVSFLCHRQGSGPDRLPGLHPAENQLRYQPGGDPPAVLQDSDPLPDLLIGTLVIITGHVEFPPHSGKKFYVRTPP